MTSAVFHDPPLSDVSSFSKAITTRDNAPLPSGVFGHQSGNAHNITNAGRVLSGLHTEQHTAFPADSENAWETAALRNFAVGIENRGASRSGLPFGDTSAYYDNGNVMGPGTADTNYKITHQVASVLSEQTQLEAPIGSICFLEKKGHLSVNNMQLQTLTTLWTIRKLNSLFNNKFGDYTVKTFTKEYDGPYVVLHHTQGELQDGRLATITSLVCQGACYTHNIWRDCFHGISNSSNLWLILKKVKHRPDEGTIDGLLDFVDAEEDAIAKGDDSTQKSYHMKVVPYSTVSDQRPSTTVLRGGNGQIGHAIWVGVAMQVAAGSDLRRQSSAHNFRYIMAQNDCGNSNLYGTSSQSSTFGYGMPQEDNIEIALAV
jgi:hypothetical protein